MYDFLNPKYRKNEVSQRRGFYISYNPHTDTSIDETAICAYGSFFILNGDHRSAYAEKELDECMDYFVDHGDQTSIWSNKPIIEGTITAEAKTRALRKGG